MYMYICISTCIYIYVSVNIHEYTYISTYTRIHIHAYIHTCIHTYMHTYIHAYMHTYIHIYIYTYIYICHPPRLPFIRRLVRILLETSIPSSHSVPGLAHSQTPGRIQEVETPNSGLQNSYNEGSKDLREIYSLDRSRGLGSGEGFAHTYMVHHI